MDGALTALYRRLGRWYVLTFMLFAPSIAFVLVLAVIYVTIDRFLALPHAFWHVLGVTLLSVEATTILSIFAIVSASRGVTSWMAGDRRPERATEVWRDAMRMPTLHWKIALPVIVVGATPALFAINAVAHPGMASMLSIALGSAMVVALGVALHEVATATFLRPILTELDEAVHTDGFVRQSGSGAIRLRIVGSTVLIIWVSVLFGTSAIAHTNDPTTRLAFTIASGLVFSVTFGFILTIALTHSVFRPLRELGSATRRVKSGELTGRVRVMSDDELGELTASFNAMVSGLRERQALYSALGTYVEPTIADRLLAEGEFLKGESIDVTVLFCDIIGFTTRAERMAPQRVVAELNEFFEIVVPVIDTHEGHTNKLLGDGLMAVFGAPLPLEAHADRALEAACEIQGRLFERYGTRWAGIGINSGMATVGTTGGGRKLDFTVIGDAVNVASRVEALTRMTGDAILLTEATRTQLRRPASLAPRGSVAIRGRTEEIPIYSALARSHA